MFWDIIKYGFMSVMLKQTRDVKALIVVYLYLLELSKSEDGIFRILYNWTRRYLGLEDIFKTCVFKLLCNLCKPGWLLGMRSKHITDYRILCFAKIDGDLVFPLCVEEGGGVTEFRPNRIVSVLFCGHVLNTLYLWTRCLDMADIKPRTSRFMTANNIMRDVHLYSRSNTFIACKEKSHEVSGDSLHTFISIGTHQFLPRSTVLTNINEIDF